MARNTHKPIYQPWCEDEFMGDDRVRRLTPHQELFYRRLLAKAFAGPWRPYLPDDDNELWWLAGCESPEEWAANKGPVLQFFRKTEATDEYDQPRPVLANKRISLDMDKIKNDRRAMSERGRLGGRASVRARRQDQSDENSPEIPLKPTESVDKDTSTFEQLSEEPMRATKQIPVLSLQILGVKAEQWEDTMAEIKTLAAAFGDAAVVQAFEEWADAQRGETFNGKPVTAFLKVATGLLSGAITAAHNPAVDALVDDLVGVSQGAVVFDAAQARLLGKLLAQYEAGEVLSAFRTYYGQIEGDPFSIKLAAKRFLEVAGQLIRLDRRNKLEAAQQEKLVTVQQKKLKDAADAEISALKHAEAAENELAEEEL